MLTTFVPRLTLVMLIQLKNAELPILVTLSGIVTSVKNGFWKAKVAILVTGRPTIVPGIVTIPLVPV